MQIHTAACTGERSIDCKFGFFFAPLVEKKTHRDIQRKNLLVAIVADRHNVHRSKWWQLHKNRFLSMDFKCSATRQQHRKYADILPDVSFSLAFARNIRCCCLSTHRKSGICKSLVSLNYVCKFSRSNIQSFIVKSPPHFNLLLAMLVWQSRTSFALNMLNKKNCKLKPLLFLLV